MPAGREVLDGSLVVWWCITEEEAEDGEEGGAWPVRGWCLVGAIERLAALLASLACGNSCVCGVWLWLCGCEKEWEAHAHDGREEARTKEMKEGREGLADAGWRRTLVCVEWAASCVYMECKIGLEKYNERTT